MFCILDLCFNNYFYMYCFFIFLFVIVVIYFLWGQKEVFIFYVLIDEDKLFFWEISGVEFEMFFFFFGIIYMINKFDFFLIESMKMVLLSIEKIIFEINMEDMGNIISLMLVMMKMFMVDGKILKDFYIEEEYKLVKVYFEKLGFFLVFLG